MVAMVIGAACEQSGAEADPMKHRLTPLSQMPSSTVAVGAAMIFILVAAAFGLTLDRPTANDAGWTLRGAIPIETPAPVSRG